MKSIIFIFSITLLSFIGNAQSTTQFKKGEDYKKAEKEVLQACNYLLDNPIDKEEGKRQQLFQFIFQWMSGTPDHTFELDEEIAKLYGNKEEILGIYLVSAAKVSIENNNFTKENLKKKAINMTVDYCAMEENNIKPSKEIKKLIKKRTE
ncbi:hypothetical protein OO013_15850 [Mangrovivirga sp. M17]|uniref:Uncharacterized protein n=1 Tax=Mangrovivirga halotolerans TaxID=2993936 RepID=A0ABT3RU93_9BACT|nr:hypothetical protein [Mangrovivirga halotolerans]MCX2745352.1 hypothetical protein [Mangrovivirga halotolerans]